jgi:DNA-binding NarL/FixJ family response regulator
MSRGFEEEGHNPTNCSAGHRVQREAGTIQVGGRANSVVVEPLPAAEGTLRAPRRHPSGVSQPRVCSDLLALPSTVMLGALRAGAAGYILKTASPQQITEAIRKVLKGESPLNQEIVMRLLMHLTSEKREGLEEERVEQACEALTSKERRRPLGALKRELSSREEEVLKLLVQGQTNQQIARNLLISTSTVKSHMRHISEKLGVCDRVQAAVRAVELGLLVEREGG